MSISSCSSTASSPEPVLVSRSPRDSHTDAIRWLPTQISSSNRHIVIASSADFEGRPYLQTLIYCSDSEEGGQYIQHQASALITSRITSLKTCPNPSNSARPIIAASNRSGKILFYTADLIEESLKYEFSVRDENGVQFACEVPAIDLNENTLECVGVGVGMRINLVKFEEKGVKRILEGDDLYSCVKWASPMEFVTGGNRKFGMHWWDQRKPGGPAAKFKGNWYEEETYGSVLSIDIHPSAKHTCLAGCTSGTVFAWDIRSSKEPVMLGGFGLGHDVSHNWIIGSDIWEIQYDNYTKSAMVCSEEGILGVINQPRRPQELLAETCAIKSFDIDKENPSDVICNLESEELAMLTRPNNFC